MFSLASRQLISGVSSISPSLSCLVCPHRLASRSLSTKSSLDLIKILRVKTGAPIVDCRKALQATENDIDKARDWLREHATTKITASGRGAEEGLVGILIQPDSKNASIVSVRSETDFTARSTPFISLVDIVAQATLQSTTANAPADIANVLAATLDEDKTVQQSVEEAVVSTRENLSVSKAFHMSTGAGTLVGYVHNRVDENQDDSSGLKAGTAAALVELDCKDGSTVSEETLQYVGKKLAMHIVAVQPRFLKVDQVPEETIESERRFVRKQIPEGKPDEVVERIVAGKMEKFLAEICLLEQEHVIEEGIKHIGNAMEEQSLEVRQFQYMSVKEV